MGNTVDQSASILTQNTTTSAQTLVNTCSADCIADASGNTLIITGRTKNININAKCTANTSCTMTNQVQSTVTNMIDNSVSQQTKAVTDFFNDFMSNHIDQKIDITSILTNNLTQITQNTCQASASTQANQNFIYVGSTGTTGNVNISADSDVHASCTMNNLAKAQTQNTVTNRTNQFSKTLGMIAVIFVAILGILLIGGLVLILLMATGVLGSSMKGGGSGGKTPEPEDDEDSPAQGGGDFTRMFPQQGQNNTMAVKGETGLRGQTGTMSGKSLAKEAGEIKPPANTGLIKSAEGGLETAGEDALFLI